VRVASATPTAPADSQPQSTQSEGFFSSLAHKMGFGSAAADATASATQPAPTKPKTTTEAKAKVSAPKADTKQASAHPAKPASADAATPAPAQATGQDNVVAGAQPVLSANSFENRFSAAK
jgi:hypothetical protein